MAKQVVWSHRELKDRKEILEYWEKRTESRAYSKKLNRIFREAIRLLSEFPKMGRPTDDGRARVKVVRHYLIIYKETENQIHILTLCDNRQDPKDLERSLP